MPHAFLLTPQDRHDRRRPTRCPAATQPIPVPERHVVLGTPLKPPFPEGLETAVFGMGCFWGAERRLLAGARRVHDRGRLRGRLHAEPDLRGGLLRRAPATPRSCSSCSTRRKTSYDELLKRFWEDHDPTQGMRQGNDVGTQYRSAIYTTSDAQREAAEASRETFQASARARAGYGEITTEIAPPARSTTPRTTTSSTWPRTRTATAASAARASPARSASASPPPATRNHERRYARNGSGPAALIVFIANCEVIRAMPGRSANVSIRNRS